MDKVCLGIPSYGPQPPDWWVPFSKMVSVLHKQDIEIVDVIQHGSMMTDNNRNAIVRKFLDTEADWLFWVDADNQNPLGAVRSLLDAAGSDRTLVCGLYYLKQDPTSPVAYRKVEDGRYDPIQGWRPGEIISIDAAGMNCVLSRRSVYEDIDKNFVPLQVMHGGLIAVHKDDIEGDVFEGTMEDTDNKVVDGVLHWRVFQTDRDTPFFSLGYGRTEDFDFFEKAARCGHQLWCDTRVEAGHLRYEAVSGADYRRQQREANGNQVR